MISIEAAGPEALLLKLAEHPDPQLPLRIRLLAEQLQAQSAGRVLGWSAGWTTLLLQYDVCKTDTRQLRAWLEPILLAWQQAAQDVSLPLVQHEIPICYDGEDLAWVAQICHLTQQQVIELHTQATYWVGAVGFAPGFAYLGGLNAQLALPRRATPRLSVPAGSLAIAEEQTAIYPQSSPGGWHLLGRCPWALFDPHQEQPCLLQLGDRVRFYAITAEEFQRLRK